MNVTRTAKREREREGYRGKSKEERHTPTERERSLLDPSSQNIIILCKLQARDATLLDGHAHRRCTSEIRKRRKETRGTCATKSNLVRKNM